MNTTIDRRVIAEYVETWEGRYAGFCICKVIEEVGKPLRVERGKAIYLKDAPDMCDWLAVYGRARSNLASRAWWEDKKRKKAA